MSFVHERNKNNSDDAMCDFAWHSKILTNRLRSISLFIDINEMTKVCAIFCSSESSKESAKPCATERLNIHSVY